MRQQANHTNETLISSLQNILQQITKNCISSNKSYQSLLFVIGHIIFLELVSGWFIETQTPPSWWGLRVPSSSVFDVFRGGYLCLLKKYFAFKYTLTNAFGFYIKYAWKKMLELF